MTNFKHLTQFELSAYHSDSLEKNERHKIGKHLLNCPDCRERLPMPSVERLWSIIMTDEEITEVTAKEQFAVSPVFTLSGLTTFLKLQSELLWSAGALVVVFCFSFLLWLNLKDSSKEVVFTINNKTHTEPNFQLTGTTPTIENPGSPVKPKVNQTPKTAKTDVPKQKIVQNDLNPKKIERNSSPKQEQFSTTRGISGRCQEEKSLGLEFSVKEANFVFKWKKVPNAVKYNLYISDDEEILIDEFETEAETTFTLKKPLDPLKTYKWKIIVTLENGNKLIGEAQKFTVKNFQTYQIKPEKRRITDIRCQANQ